MKTGRKIDSDDDTVSNKLFSFARSDMIKLMMATLQDLGLRYVRLISVALH